MTGTAVRDIRIRDWRALSDVIADVFPEMNRSLIRYLICAHHNTVRVRTENGEIIGFYIYFPLSDPSVIWMEYLGVRNNARSRGIGGDLLEDLESIAARRGHRRIEFAVDPDNHGAIALYRRRGYTEVRRHEPRKTFIKDLAGGSASSEPMRRTAGRILRMLRRALYHVLVAEIVTEPTQS